jgi:Ca2+-binding RTX toxin-like protein
MIRFEAMEQRRLLAADLIGALVLPSSVWDPGASVAATLQVSNNGASKVASQYAVKVMLAEGKLTSGAGFVEGSATVLQTLAVNTPVNAGGSANVGLSFNLPGILAAGGYTVVARVDSANQIAESDETNNLSFFPIDLLTAAGKLRVDGTDGADVISIAIANSGGSVPNPNPKVLVSVNGVSTSYQQSRLTGFEVICGGGNDVVTIDGVINGLYADGQDGDDKISGGGGDDTLVGGAGKDQLSGNDGNDRLNGNGGNDKLLGGAGVDRAYGYAGNDYLDGGSSGDRLEGGAGLDTLLGQGGNDKFFCRDGEIDQLFGASGTDQATSDVKDSISSVETNAVA